MGIIIGKFRKKKSTYEVLEKLEEQITSIEAFGRNTEQTQKRIVGRFLILAFLVYFVLAFVLYFYFYKVSTNEKLYCLLSLIALPLIIWMIKKLLTWYYSRKIKRNQAKLVTLKEEKKKMIDTVMETETYKVAKKILDKFANDSNKKPVSSPDFTPVKRNAVALLPGSIGINATGLRQRTLGIPPAARGRVSFGGAVTPVSSMPIAMRPTTGVKSIAPYNAMPGTPLPLPRGILPRDRTVLDKMVDYLVGDGPSNRFALICKQCTGHNGMALKEEFEYLSFKCCYCSTFNPARKQKPSYPKLEFETSISPNKNSDTSESEKNSSSDSDSEESTTNAIISELKTTSADSEARGDSPVSETRSDTPDSRKISDTLADVEQKLFSESGSTPMDIDSSIDAINAETASKNETTVNEQIEEITELKTD